MMKFFEHFIAVCALSVGIAGSASAQKNPDLAPTPPMGWNSWNFFGKAAINEQVCLEVMDAMAERGLIRAGYNYFVIDGGWRDKLNEKGEITVHPEKFPRGIKFLADYAHSKGLKFGLHTVPGRFDCGGDHVGGWNNEEVQVKQFVSWGVDFIKLDKCRFDMGADKKPVPWELEVEKEVYHKWAKMLRECGRDITFSISAYRYLDWYPEWCNMARTTGDIMSRGSGGCYFERSDISGKKSLFTVMEIADKNERLYMHAGNGYWNDPDMLAIGEQGLTMEEQKIHFALWCIMGSPLFLGNDPRNLSAEEVAMITNRDAIRVNQEIQAEAQGRRIYKEGDLEIWKKELAGGKCALLLLNRSRDRAGSIHADFAKLGLSAKMKVKNIYTAADYGVCKDFLHDFTARGGIFLLLEKVK